MYSNRQWSDSQGKDLELLLRLLTRFLLGCLMVSIFTLLRPRLTNWVIDLSSALLCCFDCNLSECCCVFLVFPWRSLRNLETVLLRGFVFSTWDAYLDLKAHAFFVLVQFGCTGVNLVRRGCGVVHEHLETSRLRGHQI